MHLGGMGLCIVTMRINIAHLNGSYCSVAFFSGIHYRNLLFLRFLSAHLFRHRALFLAGQRKPFQRVHRRGCQHRRQQPCQRVIAAADTG